MFARYLHWLSAATFWLLFLAGPAAAQDEPGGGMGKTIMGWGLTILMIGLGIGVVVYPSARKEPKPEKKK